MPEIEGCDNLPRILLSMKVSVRFLASPLLIPQQMKRRPCFVFTVPLVARALFSQRRSIPSLFEVSSQGMDQIPLDFSSSPFLSLFEDLVLVGSVMGAEV